MRRRSVIGSSDHPTVVIEYADYSVQELERRISEYERKYGAPLERYSRTTSCDTMPFYEMNDLMDWENLVAELTERRPRPKDHVSVP